jgi:DNA-binding MarR family transcriptional regulator
VTLAPIRAGDLAAAMKLSPSALSRNLQPLVTRRLVEMAPGEDARSRIVEATVAGHAVRASAQRDWKRAQLALNERLGVERVADLHALIDACVAALDDGSDDDGADA